MSQRGDSIEIEVEGGAIPARVLRPEEPERWPALVVVPSIYGPAPDLVGRLAPIAERALVALPDPFWRIGGGVVPYGDHETAIGRLEGFDVTRCTDDLRAVVAWVRARGNGRVAGLGICFGGPFVLRLAGEQLLDGVVTWHGSRIENFLERAGETTCPLRLHFGADDPVTPPAAIDRIRSAFASHPDLRIVVHPGAVHGYSHDGDAFDPKACQAGLEATQDILASLA